MRRLWTNSPYKAYHGRHSSKLAGRKVNFKNKRRKRLAAVDAIAKAAARARKIATPTSPQRKPRRQNPEPLPAPSSLKLMDNPVKTIRYCQLIRQYAESGTVRLDLKGVEEFSTDALLFIGAIMNAYGKGTRHPVTFSGNLPENPEVATEFKATGFFDGFFKPPENLPEPKGYTLNKSEKIVIASAAAKLLQFAARHVINRVIGCLTADR